MEEEIIIEPEEVIEEKKPVEMNDSGVAFITNNQNGMGRIIAPQP